MKKTTIIPVESSTVGPSYKIIRNDPIAEKCYLQGDGECEGELEREHVIPRVLFTPDSIGEPVVLRACSRHNKQKGKVDESAARIMQLTTGKGDVRRYGRWLDYSRSHIQQDGHVKSGGKLLREIIGSVSRRDVTTPAGIILHADQPSIELKNNPVNELFIAIAKGLIVRETGIFFNWEKYDFHLDCAQTVNGKNRIIDDPSHSMYMAYRNRTFAREWPGVFTTFGTTIKHDQYDEYAGVWGMVGYETHAAVVLVLPRDDDHRALL